MMSIFFNIWYILYIINFNNLNINKTSACIVSKINKKMLFSKKDKKKRSCSSTRIEGKLTNP